MAAAYANQAPSDTQAIQSQRRRSSSGASLSKERGLHVRPQSSQSRAVLGPQPSSSARQPCRSPSELAPCCQCVGNRSHAGSDSVKRKQTSRSAPSSREGAGGKGTNGCVVVDGDVAVLARPFLGRFPGTDRKGHSSVSSSLELNGSGGLGGRTIHLSSLAGWC